MNDNGKPINMKNVVTVVELLSVYVAPAYSQGMFTPQEVLSAYLVETSGAFSGIRQAVTEHHGTHMTLFAPQDVEQVKQQVETLINEFKSWGFTSR